MAKKKKVFIATGHGGSDPGAVGVNGVKEKDLALKISLAERDELVRHGVEVMMSRTKDENDPLTERIKECNAFKPDLAVENHLNSGKGNGCEIYHYSGGGASKRLAKYIAEEIKATGQNLRTGTSGKKDGLKVKLGTDGRDYFGWIRQTSCPAVLVEAAFIDNVEDVKTVDTDAKCKEIGVAEAKGVLKELGIKWKPEATYTVTVPGLTKAQADKLVADLKKDGHAASLKKA